MKSLNDGPSLLFAYLACPSPRPDHPAEPPTQPPLAEHDAQRFCDPAPARTQGTSLLDVREDFRAVGDQVSAHSAPALVHSLPPRQSALEMQSEPSRNCQSGGNALVRHAKGGPCTGQAWCKAAGLPRKDWWPPSGSSKLAEKPCSEAVCTRCNPGRDRPRRGAQQSRAQCGTLAGVHVHGRGWGEAPGKAGPLQMKHSPPACISPSGLPGHLETTSRGGRVTAAVGSNRAAGAGVLLVCKLGGTLGLGEVTGAKQRRHKVSTPPCSPLPAPPPRGRPPHLPFPEASGRSSQTDVTIMACAATVHGSGCALRVLWVCAGEDRRPTQPCKPLPKPY